MKYHVDKLCWFKWYWRRPDQLPYQYGPHILKVTARLAAWRATRGS